MRHIAYITKKPELSGKYTIPDGALTGNGDLGIVLGNFEDGLRVYISKADIWSDIETHDEGGLRPLGYIDIPVPKDKYDDYYVEQDMDIGELRCVFGKSHKLTIKVSKSENSIITEQSGFEEFLPKLKAFEEIKEGTNGNCEKDGCQVSFRIFSGEKFKNETKCYAAMKIIGDDCAYTYVATDNDAENPESFVVEKAKGIRKESIEKIKEEHYEQWAKFWSASSFEMSDEFFENWWYSSQFFIACCAGNVNFAPGIYGNFVTIETPYWHSDYHLNYNYQAPFYAACSSNHVELTDCYHTPLEQFYENGRKCAEKFGCRGIMYPVGIRPRGLYSEIQKEIKYAFERLFLGQKSNAIHPADIMVFRWKTTRDKQYAEEHALPYIRECLLFFEDYAKKENGKYSICDDAVHEVPYYRTDFNADKYKYIHDKNNALTLGLLRMCLEAAIDMSKELDGDKKEIAKWQEMLDNIHPFATTIRHFRKIYRYTEKGQRWNDGNDCGLQHIYPASCVGLYSDKKELKIARNTFAQKKRHGWEDSNACCSLYPMAARLGIDPKWITVRLKMMLKKYSFPNMLLNHGGGLLENCPITATTFNEMALQSHQGILTLFPCWDNQIDCKFNNLRAYGAFLVSSSMKNGIIGETEIVSEVGSSLKLANPYNCCTIETNGEKKEYSSKIIEFSTQPGQKIKIMRK